MGKKFDFDYIVIGSGPAGATTALALAKAKKEVAIVEGESFGGSAVNSRDVPYGISLDFAHTFSKLSNSPETSTQDAHFNFLLSFLTAKASPRFLATSTNNLS